MESLRGIPVGLVLGSSPFYIQPQQNMATEEERWFLLGHYGSPSGVATFQAQMHQGRILGLEQQL